MVNLLYIHVKRGHFLFCSQILLIAQLQVLNYQSSLSPSEPVCVFQTSTSVWRTVRSVGTARSVSTKSKATSASAPLATAAIRSASAPRARCAASATTTVLPTRSVFSLASVSARHRTSPTLLTGTNAKVSSLVQVTVFHSLFF